MGAKPIQTMPEAEEEYKGTKKKKFQVDDITLANLYKISQVIPKQISEYRVFE